MNYVEYGFEGGEKKERKRGLSLSESNTRHCFNSDYSENNVIMQQASARAMFQKSVAVLLKQHLVRINMELRGNIVSRIKLPFVVCGTTRRSLTLKVSLKAMFMILAFVYGLAQEKKKKSTVKLIKHLKWIKIFSCLPIKMFILVIEVKIK